MNVASLSDEELFSAFHKITTELCPENDHEKGIDGLGTDVRYRVTHCTIANGGKNITCAHCSEHNFPDFPSLAITERTISVLKISPAEKNNLLFGLSASTAIIAALDRIRIISLRPDSHIYKEIQDMIDLLGNIDHVFFKTRIRNMKDLIQMAEHIFQAADQQERAKREKNFLEKFREEKIIVTDFRKKVMENIKQHVPNP